MAENKENEIELIIRVIESTIKINLTRSRSTDVVQEGIIFPANAHLCRLLGIAPQVLIRSSGIIGFEPTGKQKPWISVKY